MSQEKNVMPVSGAEISSSFSVWEGIYESFEAAPVSGPGFSGERWRKASRDLAESTLERQSRSEVLDFSLRQRNAILPSVVALLSSFQKDVRILDVGGGMGTGYVLLRGALRQTGGIQYDILEIEEVCEQGRRLFEEQEGPRFLNAVPENLGDYDIAYMASALHYFDDWKTFIGTIARAQTKYILISDVPVGNIKSFVTIQNYYESKIASWFISEQELCDHLANFKYEQILRLPCTPMILGKMGLMPMLNLPAENRIPHAWHLLFRLTASEA